MRSHSRARAPEALEGCPASPESITPVFPCQSHQWLWIPGSPRKSAAPRNDEPGFWTATPYDWLHGIALLLRLRLEEVAPTHFRMGALVLRRVVDLAAEFHRGVPGPARIEQHAASKSDQVGLSAG